VLDLRPAPADPGTLRRARRLRSLADSLTQWAGEWASTVRVTERRWDLIAAADWFEAWVIGWPPSSDIELHDHGESLGAVNLVSGALEETAVVASRTPPVVMSTREIREGGSVSFGPGYIHDMVNRSSSTAISVHVYAPRLTRMTHYRMAGGLLLETDTLRFDQGDALQL
jgi:predicted metal-dependent enzyme (double-stranded beta helix superfamily)